MRRKGLSKCSISINSSRQAGREFFVDLSKIALPEAEFMFEGIRSTKLWKVRKMTATDIVSHMELIEKRYEAEKT